MEPAQLHTAKFYLTLLLAIFIGFLAGQFLLSNLVRIQFNSSLQNFAQTFGVSVELDQYTPGWFSATAETLVGIPAINKQLSIRHEIQYGPAWWEEEGYTPHWLLLAIDSTIAFEGMGQLADAGSGIRFHTAIPFQGDPVTTISLPAGHILLESGREIGFDADIKGGIRIMPEQGLGMDLAAPYLSFKSEGSETRLSQLVVDYVSRQESRLSSMTYDVRIENIENGADRLGPAEMSVEIKNLNALASPQLPKNSSEADQTPWSDRSPLSTPSFDWFGYFVSRITDQTRIHLQQLRIVTDSGDIRADGVLSLALFQDEDIFSWMLKNRLHANLVLPESVLINYFRQQENIQTSASAEADVESMVQKGYFTRENGTLKTIIRLQDGVLTANDARFMVLPAATHDLADY